MLTKDDILAQLQENAGLPDRALAERVMQVVAEQLRRRLTLGEANDLRGNLPPALRELFPWSSEEIGRYSHPTHFEFGDFIQHVADEADMPVDMAADATRWVFRALKEHLPTFETKHVADQLPKLLKIIWLEA